MFKTQLPAILHKSLIPAVCVAGSLFAAQAAMAQTLGDVFVIDMENHNFTQPGTYTSTQALFNNPAAPYVNSLITAGNANATQTSWASNYTSVGSGVHPSEPNYIWQEAGSNLGVTNDNQPYGTGGTNQNTSQHLTGLLQTAGISWKAYQEDADINYTTGTVLTQNQWTVPLNNKSGVYTGTNTYNGSHQYDFAAKHDGTLFFTDTNGGNDTTTMNAEIPHYAPLQQFASDLTSGAVARYNLITPNQFNDAHTGLTNGFTYNGTAYTGDAAKIAQGDNFLSILLPQIEASDAYKNNGVIDIWWDETEGGDTAAFTLENIVISPLAKGNAYQSTMNYTHSSDLKTYQELFGVQAQGGGFLGAANNAGTNDLSDLFKTGAINAAPEPSAWAALAFTGLGITGLAFKARNRSRTL